LTVISTTCSKLLEIDTNGPIISAAVGRAKNIETSRLMLKEMEIEQDPAQVQEEEPEVKPEDQKEDDDNE
jgi:hypothetical protein